MSEETVSEVSTILSLAPLGTGDGGADGRNSGVSLATTRLNAPDTSIGGSTGINVGRRDRPEGMGSEAVASSMPVYLGPAAPAQAQQAYNHAQVQQQADARALAQQQADARALVQQLADEAEQQAKAEEKQEQLRKGRAAGEKYRERRAAEEESEKEHTRTLHRDVSELRKENLRLMKDKLMEENGRLSRTKNHLNKEIDRLRSKLREKDPK